MDVDVDILKLTHWLRTKLLTFIAHPVHSLPPCLPSKMSVLLIRTPVTFYDSDDFHIIQQHRFSMHAHMQQYEAGTEEKETLLNHVPCNHELM